MQDQEQDVSVNQVIQVINVKWILMNVPHIHVKMAAYAKIRKIDLAANAPLVHVGRFVRSVCSYLYFFSSMDVVKLSNYVDLTHS